MDRETYERVRAAGFKWAPKQELFVAELCGDIEDEDKTLADRAEERAERFDNYSGKRAQESDAA